MFGFCRRKGNIIMKFANGKKNADMKYLSVVLVYASCNEKSIVF